MSNTRTITCRKHIKEDVFLGALEEINQRRFDGIFKVGWGVYLGDECWFDFEQPTKWRIETQYPHADIKVWVWAVFINDLALALGGRFSDDGAPGHWEPKPNFCPTYFEWVSGTYPRVKEDYNMMFVALWESYLKECPEQLLPFME